MSHPRVVFVVLMAALAAVCGSPAVVSMSQSLKVERLHETETFSFHPHESADYSQQGDGRPMVGQTDAQVSFAASFGSNMVLQRAPYTATVWGYSGFIGEHLIVEFSNSTWKTSYTTTVTPGWQKNQGLWKLTLEAQSTPGPYTITVHSNGGSISLNNVLFGDVWVCSGQSNMEFTVSQILNAEEELEHAGDYPNVRLYSVARLASSVPLYDVQDIREPWSLPSKASVGNGDFTYFSAVCWLFGKKLYEKLKVPIGLIDTTWGGTPVEAWSSPDGLASCGLSQSGTPSFGVIKGNPANGVDEYSQIVPPNTYSSLWNGMVHPLLNMTIYGAIWYQGEANVHNDQARYNCTFPEMIKDWRRKFHEGSNGITADDFPFGFVQLAPNVPDQTVEEGTTNIRWHQTADYGYTPNPRLPRVFMAVALDLPDFTSPYGSIHPRDKTTVAERLLPGALTVAYKQEGYQFQGPMPVHASKYAGLLTLQYGTNIATPSESGFEVCCSLAGSDTECTSKTSWWLPAPVFDSRASTVTLDVGQCGAGQNILGLRFLWRESPCAYKYCTVYSASPSSPSLPAPPFVYYFFMKENQTEASFDFDWSEPITIKT